jgi:hypothetical protein
LPPIALEPARRTKNAIKGTRWPLNCGQRLHPSVARRAPGVLVQPWKARRSSATNLGVQFSVRTTNLVPWWRAFMRLAGFRAEKLCKVRAGGVCRAQVCCGDPHKHTGARVATTCNGVALPLPCQTGKRQKGVGRHQALVGDGCLFGMRTASHGYNSGTSLFVGVLATDLRPANNPNMHLAQLFRTKACEAHESSPPRDHVGGAN